MKLTQALLQKLNMKIVSKSLIAMRCL